MGHAKKERVLLFGTDQRITSGPAVKRPRLKAGYMTAPERFADSQIPLAPRAVRLGEDGPLAKPFGVTYAPITYPGERRRGFSLVRQEKPDAPELARCWRQQEPAHKQEYPEVADVRPVRASRGLEEAGRSLPQELDV